VNRIPVTHSHYLAVCLAWYLAVLIGCPVSIWLIMSTHSRATSSIALTAEFIVAGPLYCLR
jgi:ABC-type proline/glycine betaine transport system permease subunit